MLGSGEPEVFKWQCAAPFFDPTLILEVWAAAWAHCAEMKQLAALSGLEAATEGGCSSAELLLVAFLDE